MTSEFSKSLPSKFVRNITSLCGEKGIVWLDGLPGLLGRLEKEWSVQIGQHFPVLSYNFVAPAITSRGDPAVVKVALPLNDAEVFGEIKYLQWSDGKACPRLLEISTECRAILIERAVPGRTLRELFKGREDDALQILCDVLPLTLRRVPQGPSGFILLDDWFAGLNGAAGTAFPSSHAERAARYYRELSGDKDRIYLLHGDLHHENILSAEREPFLAIDPKGIVGHFGYEIAVFLNNHLWWVVEKPGALASLDLAVSLYAKEFGIPERDLRKWAFCQMVLSTWWSFDEMNESFSEGLAFADMWRV
jgi:streptomycin 6-kinase